MIWWIWTLIGLALAVAELMTPGFFIIFLAAGAVASAVLSLIWPASPLWSQMLVFSLFSALSLIFFRKPLMRRFGLDRSAPSREEIVNESATPLGDIAPGATGKAELRGTSWSARNGGTTTLAKGQRCKVKKLDGLTLWLTPD